MRLALECPTAMLDEIQPLADFSFALAHLVLQDEEYASWYKDSVHSLVMLDNSVNELGKPVSIEDMVKAQEIIDADLIFPPDFIGKIEKTLVALGEFCEVFPPNKIFPIVQGNSVEEVLDCANEIKKILGSDVSSSRLAVPYDICSDKKVDTLEQLALRRTYVIDNLTRYFKYNWIHLLGVTDLEELSWYSDRPVLSVDSGTPILNGIENKRLGIDEQVPKGILFNYGGAYSITPSIFYNIAYLRKMMVPEGIDMWV